MDFAVEEHGFDLVQLIFMLAQEPAQLVFDIDEFAAERVMGRRRLHMSMT
jgi:hypothetical protein